MHSIGAQVSHLSPSYPSVHAQVNPPTRSVHMPRPEQGSPAQSSVSTSQSVPVQPASQVQVYLLMPSLHVPCVEQVFPAQSFTLVSQLPPENPALHAHCPFLQLPRFEQLFPAHGSVFFFKKQRLLLPKTPPFGGVPPLAKVPQ